MTRSINFTMSPGLYILFMAVQLLFIVLALLGVMTWLVALIPAIVFGLIFLVVAPIALWIMYLLVKIFD